MKHAPLFLSKIRSYLTGHQENYTAYLIVEKNF